MREHSLNAIDIKLVQKWAMAIYFCRTVFHIRYTKTNLEIFSRKFYGKLFFKLSF